MFLRVNLNNFDPISPNSEEKIFNTPSFVEITVVIAVVILGNTIGSDFTEVNWVDTLVDVELIVVGIKVDDKCCVELREL